MTPDLNPYRIRLEPFGFEAIDLTELQAVIRRKYGPRYHVSDAWRDETAALWGILPGDGSINEHGVFLTYSDPVAVRAGRCRAEVQLARSPSGLWAMETCHATHDSGAGAAPGISNRIAFLCEDNARHAGLHRMISIFEAIAGLGRSSARDAAALVAKLKEARTPQLTLF